MNAFQCLFQLLPFRVSNNNNTQCVGAPLLYYACCCFMDVIGVCRRHWRDRSIDRRRDSVFVVTMAFMILLQSSRLPSSTNISYGGVGSKFHVGPAA
jgi:hypothetical protein